MERPYSDEDNHPLPIEMNVIRCAGVSGNINSSTDMEGEDMVVRYTATTSSTGPVSNRYATGYTGYTVTADYPGEVAKTNCEIVTYTAIFGCTDVSYIPALFVPATPGGIDAGPLPVEEDHIPDVIALSGSGENIRREFISLGKPQRITG